MIPFYDSIIDIPIDPMLSVIAEHFYQTANSFVGAKLKTQDWSLATVLDTSVVQMSHVVSFSWLVNYGP